MNPENRRALARTVLRAVDCATHNHSGFTSRKFPEGLIPIDFPAPDEVSGKCR